MAVEVKFCGLTRPQDAALGASLGARYLGVVFAESPRRVDAQRARAVFAAVTDLPEKPRRVGVFGRASVDDVLRRAGDVGLDVVQMHGDPSPEDVVAVGANFDGEIWAARRIFGEAVPGDLEELAQVADRLLLDGGANGGGGVLGGTGQAFAWEAVARCLARLRALSPLVVAGGLTPFNVARAIEFFAPSVVDVSSGIESAPGIKDPELMRAFLQVVRTAA